MLEVALEKILWYPKQSLALCVIVLIVVLSFVWWQFAWQNPQRVFEDMLTNNLQTVSVTKQASAGTAQQGVDQFVRLEMGSTNATDWVVTARQSNALVSTESIATPDTGYIRYLAISVPTSSHKLDASKVVNVWGKADGKTDITLSQLFDQALLDIGSAPLPPIANLSVAQQQKLVDYMVYGHVFTPDYKTVKRAVINGRGVYTYTVQARLGAYVNMMQSFAHMFGLHNLDTIDPNQYAATPPIILTFSVDRLSHQLVRASYPATGFTQTYTDWGLLQPIQLPKATLTTTELQQRINSLAITPNS